MKKNEQAICNSTQLVHTPKRVARAELLVPNCCTNVPVDDDSAVAHQVVFWRVKISSSEASDALNVSNTYPAFGPPNNVPNKTN